MAILSPKRAAVPDLSSAGMNLMNRGKVRDTYKQFDAPLLFSYATDAVSIFDFVLNTMIPQKGQVLTALTHFWLTKLAEIGIRTHLIAAGARIDEFLPLPLCDNPNIQSRMLVIGNLKMHPYEFIARGFLTGSALKRYDPERGEVYGHFIGDGLQDGDSFPYTLDTPTTKAEVGHDEPVSAEEVRKKYPEETHLLIKIYGALSRWTNARGIILADTKLEFGIGSDDKVYLGDEVGTPDSSRFWDKTEWLEGQKKEQQKSPPSLDKQIARDWGKLALPGIDKLDAGDPANNERVHQLIMPDNIVRSLTQTYRYILWRLTSKTLEAYWADLDVKLPVAKKKVVIVAGSKSDLPLVRHALYIRPGKHPDFWTQVNPQELTVHVISCHRNPIELVNFIESGCDGADVIVCVGGKAFALPGVLDAWIHAKGLNIPVVGVALGDPHSRSRSAAELSIEELPGQPVVIDELTNRVYAGPGGLAAALERIDTGELPPPKPRQEKPAEFNISL